MPDTSKLVLVTPRPVFLLIASFSLALCLMAMPASGAFLVDDRPFSIESITVTGNAWVSSDVIVSESLLKAGGSYNELELRQAVYRIQHLPFVLDASFALQKGSERGRYILVITIEEVRRFFFGENVVYTLFTNSVAFDSPLGGDRVISPGQVAGVRLFVGRYNMFFASVGGGDSSSFQAGYTRYDLLSRGIALSAGFTTRRCCPVRVFSLGLDPSFSSWRNLDNFEQARVSLGVPLGDLLGSQWSLRFQLLASASEEGERRNLLGSDRPRFSLDYEDLEERVAEVSLVYDSTDDAIFPTQGKLLTTTLDYQQIEADFSSQTRPDIVEVAENSGIDLSRGRSSQLRLSANLEQHWRLSERMTLSTSARLAAARARVRNLPVIDTFECLSTAVDCIGEALRLVDEDHIEVFEGYFKAKLSTQLWRSQRLAELGDLRFENSMEFGYDNVSPDLGLPDNPLYRKSVTTSVVLRNRWGLFRFSFKLADFSRGF